MNLIYYCRQRELSSGVRFRYCVTGTETEIGSLVHRIDVWFKSEHETAGRYVASPKLPIRVSEQGTWLFEGNELMSRLDQGLHTSFNLTPISKILIGRNQFEVGSSSCRCMIARIACSYTAVLERRILTGSYFAFKDYDFSSVKSRRYFNLQVLE